MICVAFGPPRLLHPNRASVTVDWTSLRNFNLLICLSLMVDSEQGQHQSCCTLETHCMCFSLFSFGFYCIRPLSLCIGSSAYCHHHLDCKCIVTLGGKFVYYNLWYHNHVMGLHFSLALVFCFCFSQSKLLVTRLSDKYCDPLSVGSFFLPNLDSRLKGYWQNFGLTLVLGLYVCV